MESFRENLVIYYGISEGGRGLLVTRRKIMISNLNRKSRSILHARKRRYKRITSRIIETLNRYNKVSTYQVSKIKKINA